MVIKSAVVVNKNKKEIDVKVTNGHREFMVEISKENISFDNIKDKDVNVRVYSLIRTCCASCPKYVLESGKNEKDDEEIAQLINDICELIK